MVRPATQEEEADVKRTGEVHGIDLTGRAVLVTGGTRGLGRAIALEFARAGATVCVTHKWGTTPEQDVREVFEHAGLAPPLVARADVGEREDTLALMRDLATRDIRLHGIVSNVAFGSIPKSVDELSRRDFERTLRYSAWPMIDLIQAAKEVWGQYPRYLIGISSRGASSVADGYDYLGMSKAVMESMARYLAIRLRTEGVRVNVVRAGYFLSDSMEASFGLNELNIAEHPEARKTLMDPAGVARACVALCSGYFDAMTGQVLTVDEGWDLLAPIAWVTGGTPDESFPDDTE